MHLADMAALGTVKAECERQVRILLNGCFDLMHVTRRTGTPTNSIRLWIPRSVALHKIQIKILLLWICPRHFAVCVGKALGIRIRLKCSVSAQPKMMIFKMFQTCSQLVALEFRPPANFFPGGSLQCPAASETAVFPAGLQEGQQVFAAHESGECVG